MIIGQDFFAMQHGNAFQTPIIHHQKYASLELSNGQFDELFIDEDVAIPYSTEKPAQWNYRTVMHAKFNGDFEAGSVTAGGLQIERIRVQKREGQELAWVDVAEIPYSNISGQVLYEFVDRYIKTNFEYEYSLVPMTATILGNRVLSEPFTPDFEGIYLSDKDNNYRLLYDTQFDAIEHQMPSSTVEPLNAQFPIVTYGSADYTKFGVSALFVSAATSEAADGSVNIRMEHLSRQRLLQFMKNRKPKVYRDMNGNTKLVAVVGNPKEDPHSQITGLAKLSFSLVEIGAMDSKALVENGLIAGVGGV